eukprot:COSAG03_NODE_569_length_6899_cov_3.150147_8_plen_49_part_00
MDESLTLDSLIKEIEDIFELSNNYDENIIEIQETKLRQNILVAQTSSP